MLNKEVVISYVKTNDFKTTLINGVYGGISSNGLISANFFVERIPIPESETVTIDLESSRIVGPTTAVKTADVVREVQHGALLDVSTAEILIKWLQEKVTEIKKIQHGT
jgi:hypothetical protein